MKLLKKLGTRLNNKGIPESWGEFYCEFCNQEVEKRLRSGKIAKSCGCKQYELASKSRKGQKQTKEHSQKISLANKGKKRTEEQRQRMSEAHKGKISPNKNKKLTEQHKQKVSKTRIERGVAKGENNPNYGNGTKISGKNNPMYGVHRYGKENPNWNNGSSFEPYSPEFNSDLKQQILERDDYTCQNPDCLEKSDILCVHHIDYDKKNSNPENLVTLCNDCHGKTTGKNNRKYFIEYYKNIMLQHLYKNEG